MQNQDEAELIAHSLNDDHEAYAELIDRYKNALYHHCFAIVRTESVAEDIAQETFITAFYKLARYKPEYKFSTWLFKIATNKALTWLKTSKRETLADETLIARIVSSQPEPSQHAEDQELYDAVDQLTPRYRTIVSLYYWQGMSYRDIALVVGAPEGSVKGWMNRAKAQLRKELS